MTAPACPPPRFSPGCAVRVADRAVSGHCRTPFYLRGRPGTVVAVAGRYLDPGKLAYHNPGLPAQYLYRVRFAQTALWNAAAETGGETGGETGHATDADALLADIFEPWLEPAEKDASP